MRPLLLALALAAYAAPAVADEPAAIPATFLRATSATTLPGKAPEWDYLVYEPVRHLLLIGRRDDGVFVFDTIAKTVLRRIDQSAGANAAIIIPSLDRGFTTNEDGSTTIFTLSTFSVIRRLKFADDADAAVFDPITGQVAFMSGDSQKITLIDARSLQVTATIAMPSKKLEAAAADGAGGLYVAERDRNMLAHVDLRAKALAHEWPTIGCIQPTGLAFDATHRRVMLGCRGDKPVLAILDSDDGHVVATPVLGRGNDGVVYDAVHSRLFATNGVDGNLVVYHQDDADHYRLIQAVTTRPGARTLAYDITGQRIFTVSAEGVVDPARPVNSGPSPFYPNAFVDDSFVVLELAPEAAR